MDGFDVTIGRVLDSSSMYRKVRDASRFVARQSRARLGSRLASRAYQPSLASHRALPLTRLLAKKQIDTGSSSCYFAAVEIPRAKGPDDFQDKTRLVAHRLRASWPRVVDGEHDYSIYSPEVKLIDNVHGFRISGIAALKVRNPLVI